MVPHCVIQEAMMLRPRGRGRGQAEPWAESWHEVGSVGFQEMGIPDEMRAGDSWWEASPGPSCEEGLFLGPPRIMWVPSLSSA